MFAYAAVLVCIGSECIHYIAPLALMQGFGCGMYYIIYNQYEAEGLSDDLSARASFFGIYNSVSTITKVVYPFVTGFLMDRFGITPVGIVCGISSLSAILFTAVYKDNGYKGRVSFKQYFKMLTKDNEAKKSVICFAACDFFRAFTCSYASFSLFVSICLIGFSKNAGAFGSANSALFLLSMAFSTCFGRMATKRQAIIWNMQKVLQVFMVVSGIAMFGSSHVGLFFQYFHARMEFLRGNRFLGI